MVKKHGYWLLAILGVAFLLRASMWKNSLWLDEAYSVRQAAFSQQDIWVDKVDPVHPPLYYAILHEWTSLFGDSEIAIRLPSLIVSLINMGLLCLLARLIFNKDVALVAFSLLAVSPLAVWYAGEARMYSFVAFVGLLAAVGLAWEHWLGLVVYGIALAAGLYLDYTFLPLWTAITAVWLVYWWLRGHQWWRLVGWVGITSLAWLFYQPWYPKLFGMLARLNKVSLFVRLNETIGLPAFESYQYLWLMPFIAGGIILGVCLLLLLLRRQTSRLILTVLILSDFILVTLLTPVPRAFTLKRVVVTGWPFVLLLVAWLVVQLSSHRRLVWYGLLGISFISTLLMILFTPKDDWRNVVAFVNEQVDKQAVVLIDPKYNEIPYNYYQPHLAPHWVSVDGLAETPVSDVWLVVERFPGSFNQYTPTEQWLNENRELVETIPFYRLEIRHYAP